MVSASTFWSVLSQKNETLHNDESYALTLSIAYCFHLSYWFLLSVDCTRFLFQVTWFLYPSVRLPLSTNERIDSWNKITTVWARIRLYLYSCRYLHVLYFWYLAFTLSSVDDFVSPRTLLSLVSNFSCKSEAFRLNMSQFCSSCSTFLRKTPDS